MAGWRSLLALRTVVRGYIGFAMVACAVVAPAGLAYITYDLAERQNEIANAGKRRQMEALLAFIEAQFQQHTFDYTHWDEPYLRLVHELDADWFQVNMGASLYGAVLHHASAVLDDSGRTLVGAWHDQPEAWDPRARIGSPFDKLFARLRAAPEDIDAQAGFAVVEGRIALIAVGPITPILEPPIARRRYAVFVREITDEILDDYRALTGQHDLHLRLGGDDGQHGVPIADPGGVVLGGLSWTPLTPGTAAWRAALPKMAASTALLLGLVVFALYRAQLSQHALAASEARASHLAHHDPLTRLANRRSLQAAIERSLALPVRHQLLLVDLDGFKEVNDSLGHPVGDLVLTEIARRLAARVGDWGTVGRLGGDEFAVLVRGDTSVGERLAATLLELVEAPVEIPLQAVSVSATIGVAASDGVDTVSELLRRADVALYEAKAAGKRRVAVYRPELDRERARRREIEDDIRHGLERGEFRVAFQPFHRSTSGRVAGAEALLRWHHPVKGAIPPALFIPVAEETRLINELGAFVLREACRAVRDLDGLPVAVNLSPIQLLDERLVERIQVILAETGLPPTRLEVEITEGYLIQQPDRAAEVLRRLRALGVKVSLDDFGSGFASLGYLRRFRLDKIKLDRSFIQSVAVDPQARRITNAVVELGRALDIPVTAEGVETEEQARLVRAAGCELQQGFFYSRPMSAGELATFVRDGAAAARPAARLGAVPVDA